MEAAKNKESLQETLESVAEDIERKEQLMEFVSRFPELIIILTR
jgi:hypothetical protein